MAESTPVSNDLLSDIATDYPENTPNFDQADAVAEDFEDEPPEQQIIEEVPPEPIKVIDAAATAMVKKERRAKSAGIFSAVMISQRAYISIRNVGDNIKQSLEKKVSFDIEGKCIVEGYVKPGSCKVISYSSGQLSGSDVVFEVIIECLVCCPVEGMHITCIVKNITESAGIKAETDDDPSPVIIYIARDHHINNPMFNKVIVGNKIKVRVIGQRFELNDSYISVIAELIDDNLAKHIKKKL